MKYVVQDEYLMRASNWFLEWFVVVKYLILIATRLLSCTWALIAAHWGQVYMHLYKWLV